MQRKVSCASHPHGSINQGPCIFHFPGHRITRPPLSLWSKSLVLCYRKSSHQRTLGRVDILFVCFDQRREKAGAPCVSQGRGQSSTRNLGFALITKRKWSAKGKSEVICDRSCLSRRPSLSFWTPFHIPVLSPLPGKHIHPSRDLYVPQVPLICHLR